MRNGLEPIGNSPFSGDLDMAGVTEGFGHMGCFGFGDLVAEERKHMASQCLFAGRPVFRVALEMLKRPGGMLIECRSNRCLLFCRF